MSTFAVVVVPDERRAHEGLRALAVLHEEGSLTAYATAVVGRRTDGMLEVKERTAPGALGFGIGGLIGALVGQFGEPPGAAAGVRRGGCRDHLHAEVTDEFLESVARELVPGSFAVVAEISEEWLTPLDARMAALGGTVVRAWRQDFVEVYFEERKDVARMDAILTAHVADAERSLQKVADEALKRLDETRAELAAKIAVLEEQARKVKPDVRTLIERRITGTCADLRERETKLLRAYALAREVVVPPGQACESGAVADVTAEPPRPTARA